VVDLVRPGGPVRPGGLVRPPGPVRPRGLAGRALRSVQRGILDAAMTLAAVVAERRIRRALRRDDGRGRSSG
jgi:hypothetical protein